MNIEIEHCKNIRSLNLEVQSEKVNVIVANSGSGKSSVVKALQGEDRESLQSVYWNNTPSVKINGNVSIPKFKVFDSSFSDNVVFERSSSEEVYNVFVGDKNLFNQYRNDLSSVLSRYYLIEDSIKIYVDKVKNLEKEVLKKRAQATLPTPSSKLVKFEGQLASATPNQKRIIKSFSSKKFKWISDGDAFKLNDKCPYCNRKLGQHLIKKYDIIKAMNIKEFTILEDADPVLNDLGISINNYFSSRSLAKLKQECLNKILIKNELLLLDEKIKMYSNYTFSSSRRLEKIKLKSIVYTEFPDLENIIEDLNQSSHKLNELYNKSINKFNKLIRKTAGTLNRQLVTFGIPYSFEVDDISLGDSTANYVLYHNHDHEKKDRTFGLSYGERNIVSLLLFLIKIDEDYVIIDDPASSFDEYKRKTIYDIILSSCKGKTTLIFSHDLVFGKFFVLDKYKSRSSETANKLGNLIFLENYNFEEPIEVKEITLLDFKPLQDHLIDYLSESDLLYVEKIIALRMLFETVKNRKKSKIIYQYLSAVLHEVSPNLLVNDLTAKGTNEEAVIRDMIQYLEDHYDLVDFEIEAYNDYHIPGPIKNNFIKMMKLREITVNSNVRKEISSIIHLNEAQMIQINPFKFNYYSKYIHDAIIDSGL